MKRISALILAAICILSAVSFSAASANVGKVVGFAAKTDIAAYINNYPIRSYNIDGYTSVVAEDLANYGFNVVWDGIERTLSINEDPYAKKIKGMPGVTKAPKSQIGKKAFDVFRTDIRTYINGIETTGYNIGGQTVIDFEELKVFGNVYYDNSRRAIFLEIARFPKEDFVPVEVEAPKVPKGYTTVILSDEYIHTGSLILVNGNHPYSFDNVPDLVPAEELVPVNYDKTSKNYKVKDNTVKLNRTTVAALDAMFDAFFDATEKKDVIIWAGYLTKEDSIYSQKFCHDLPPGFSEHHTGYSVDFLIYTDGGITKRFTAQDEYAWVAENAHKYGFILRYPEGKSYITGVEHEARHYRYVGNPHSTYIYNNNITLEEYVQILREYPCGSPLYITGSDGVVYRTYYVESTGETTVVPVPEKNEYTLSGNNIDGYIVTEILPSDNR